MRLNTLIFFGACAFALSGALNILADFLPIMATRLLNFAGVSLGIFGLLSLYLFTHVSTGRSGLAGYVIATLGYIGIAGFLFADAFVLAHLPPDTAAALLEGPTGLSIFASVILYVIGTVIFAFAVYRGGRLPRPAVLLWAVGTLPTLAAIALPAYVMAIAEILISIGIIWMSVTIVAALRADDTAAVAPQP